MSRSTEPFSLTHVVAGYVTALVAVVAGLTIWPFSQVLSFALFALVGAFFLFALAVLAGTLMLPLVALFTTLPGAAGRLRSWVLARPGPGDDPIPVRRKVSEPEYGPPELWDAWLDGARYG
jgi:hypothetical protein